ncbi:hypothetical protein [Streptomyces sp. 8L]|uniref:hypothetical protein n=1 Tax=Streptomyces sp. 8L TaxID=2877242 RepID=UPI001CD208EB|nr:hypothetical protein [Streptomyces sp. 8L]MCA1218543.1 hypothetical protein [Streptomyces sp. 8L]
MTAAPQGARRSARTTAPAGGAQGTTVPLEEAARHFGLRLAGVLKDGGSDSACALATTPDGGRVVVKCLQPASERVDGHGLKTFRAKRDQQELLGRTAPAVARSYAAVLDSAHTRAWSAYVLEYYPWPTLVEALRAGGDLPDLLGPVLRSLIADGYAHITGPGPERLWQSMYLERLARRRWILERQLPADLLGDGCVTVNGRRVYGLRALLRRAGAADAGALFAGSPLSQPVHGDLNLRNILVAPPGGGGFRLLDPRGVLTPWDVVYDLAKMLFTLTLFDDTMRTGFTVGGSPGSYTVAAGAPSPLRASAAGFLGLLPRLWTALADAGFPAGPWTSRLLFAHASHVLAEAACRLSDRAEPPPVRYNRSLGLFLNGLLLMTDLLDGLDRGTAPEAASHLGLTGRADGGVLTA